MKKNPPKALNTIQFEMDPYTSVLDIMGIEFDNNETIFKSYTFERFDTDIINSPISHKVQKCNLNLELTTKKQIQDLRRFLFYLEESIETKEKNKKKKKSNKKISCQK